jgi:hypothetical protein
VGSPAAALAMVFKLARSAQARWRAITAPHLVALVRAGATFVRGELVERPDDPMPHPLLPKLNSALGALGEHQVEQAREYLVEL